MPKDSHQDSHKIVEQLGLFSVAEQQACVGLDNPDVLLEMNREALRAWKHRIYDYQQQVKAAPSVQQGNLFELPSASLSLDRAAESSGRYTIQNTMQNTAESTEYRTLHRISSSSEPTQINPFELPRRNTEFWRSKTMDQGVAALYFVIDYALPILLYVGETVKSNQRWKGEHDCKRYLVNYQQAHYQNQITTQLGTAFWSNAPIATRSRQKLESSLIYYWRSPFNQENWEFWGTPFVGNKHEF